MTAKLVSQHSWKGETSYLIKFADGDYITLVSSEHFSGYRIVGTDLEKSMYRLHIKEIHNLIK